MACRRFPKSGRIGFGGGIFVCLGACLIVDFENRGMFGLRRLGLGLGLFSIVESAPKSRMQWFVLEPTKFYLDSL